MSNSGGYAAQAATTKDRDIWVDHIAVLLAKLRQQQQELQQQLHSGGADGGL